MADQPVPAAELAAMSGTFRPLADLLAATPFSDRGRIFDFCLSGWPDRDAIVRAVADADPTGPAPPILPSARRPKIATRRRRHRAVAGPARRQGGHVLRPADLRRTSAAFWRITTTAPR